MTTESSEIETLNSICRQAKAAGKLSGDNLTKLYELFGQRFTKALDALKEGRVKKYVLIKLINCVLKCKQRKMSRLPLL